MKFSTSKIKHKKKNKLLLKICDDLWREIVRLRAGNKSELSGDNVSILHCHHFKGKLSYALRFDIRGGICLTASEHFKAHASDNYDMVTRIRDYIKKREGDNIFDILEMQKNFSGADLSVIKLSLENQLKELRDERDKVSLLG